MRNTPQTFAQILKNGLEQIKQAQNITLGAIRDEIGHKIGRSGSAIEYWGRGNTPDTQTAIALTANMLEMAGGTLTLAWARQMLVATGLKDGLLESAVAEMPIPAARRQSGHPNLPPRLYRHLVGRNARVESIVSMLDERQRVSFFGIDGVGGIGKSALALEVATTCVTHSLFPNYVWISAEPHNFTQLSLTFNDLVTQLCVQLGIDDVGTMTHAIQQQKLRERLHEQPALIVLDNLETASEPQENLIKQLNSIVGNSRVLMTSRKRFAGQIHTTHLGGLTPIGTKRFVEQEINDKDFVMLRGMMPHQIKLIAEKTGGSPLAIQLILGQLQILDLELALQQLEQGAVLSETESNEYARFYRHVFVNAWTAISALAISFECKHLLLSLAQFSAQDGGRAEDLRYIADLPTPKFVAAIQQLWRLSLVEVSQRSTVASKRYFLHPLTRNFIRAEVQPALQLQQGGENA